MTNALKQALRLAPLVSLLSFQAPLCGEIVLAVSMPSRVQLGLPIDVEVEIKNIGVEDWEIAPAFRPCQLDSGPEIVRELVAYVSDGRGGEGSSIMMLQESCLETVNRRRTLRPGESLRARRRLIKTRTGDLLGGLNGQAAELLQEAGERSLEVRYEGPSPDHATSAVEPAATSNTVDFQIVAPRSAADRAIWEAVLENSELALAILIQDTPLWAFHGVYDSGGARRIIDSWRDLLARHGGSAYEPYVVETIHRFGIRQEVFELPRSSVRDSMDKVTLRRIGRMLPATAQSADVFEPRETLEDCPYDPACMLIRDTAARLTATFPTDLYDPHLRKIIGDIGAPWSLGRGLTSTDREEIIAVLNQFARLFGEENNPEGILTLLHSDVWAPFGDDIELYREAMSIGRDSGAEPRWSINVRSIDMWEGIPIAWAEATIADARSGASYTQSIPFQMALQDGTWRILSWAACSRTPSSPKPGFCPSE
jgi:hypothetical protein